MAKRSGGIPETLPRYWFVPCGTGQEGMLTTEAMTERFMQAIPNKYSVKMASPRLRIPEQRTLDELESRRVRSRAGEARHL